MNVLVFIAYNRRCDENQKQIGQLIGMVINIGWPDSNQKNLSRDHWFYSGINKLYCNEQKDVIQMYL